MPYGVEDPALLPGCREAVDVADERVRCQRRRVAFLAVRYDRFPAVLLSVTRATLGAAGGIGSQCRGGKEPAVLCGSDHPSPAGQCPEFGR